MKTLNKYFAGLFTLCALALTGCNFFVGGLRSQYGTLVISNRAYATVIVDGLNTNTYPITSIFLYGNDYLNPERLNVELDSGQELRIDYPAGNNPIDMSNCYTAFGNTNAFSNTSTIPVYAGETTYMIITNNLGYYSYTN